MSTRLAATPEPALLRADEAAAYLNISRATFYRYVIKDVPAIRVGSAPRWRRADLDAWLNAQAAAGARDGQR